MGETFITVTFVGTRASATVNALVDTGMTDSQFTPELAEEIGVTELGLRAVNLGAGAGVYEAHAVGFPSAEIAGRSTSPRVAYLVGLIGNENVVGLNILEGARIAVYPHQSRTYLANPRDRQERSRNHGQHSRRSAKTGRR